MKAPPSEVRAGGMLRHSENSRSRSALLHVLSKKKGVLISNLEEACYPLLKIRNFQGRKGKVRDHDACR
eukprot:6394199-Pyramimonas_sp.AAC.1